MEYALRSRFSFTGDEIEVSVQLFHEFSRPEHGCGRYAGIPCEIRYMDLGNYQKMALGYWIKGDDDNGLFVFLDDMCVGSSVYDFAEDTRIIDCGFHLRSLVLTAAVAVHHNAVFFFEFIETGSAALAFMIT